ncbi:hypothetical protein BASA81_010288 [Batrachochytrium salamandrivorans]|nr:hypothetical protein BASA81_010288 [Batrachochytrium salamandrivorans]
MEGKALGKSSLSSRLLPASTSSRGFSKGGSTIGALMRSSVPAWVEHLKDGGLTDEQERKLKESTSECSLCHCSLKGLTDLEPQNKKLCRVCNAVLCRQCVAQVHVKGHLRRRYVCFRCVGEAAVHTRLVQPQIVETVVEVVTTVLQSEPQQVQEEEDEDEGVVATFVTRLWDTWSGWTIGGGGKQEDLVEEASFSPMLLSKDPPALVMPQLELSGEEQMANVTMMLASSDKFNGDVLRQLMEQSRIGTNVLVLPFTDGCKEIVKLMAGLGKAFEFAGGDMNDKLRIMDRRALETANESKLPLNQVTVQHMVEREIANKTTHAGKKAAGATRTIVRLLWFLDFIAVLLTKLAISPQVALVTTIGNTYDETLSPRHVWVLRRVVKSGLSLVPDKRAFLERMGVASMSEQEQCSKFKLWAATLDAVRGDLWTYMGSKGLMEIP